MKGVEDSLSRGPDDGGTCNMCPESTRWEVEKGQQGEAYVIKSQDATHFIPRYKKALSAGIFGKVIPMAVAMWWVAWRGRLKGVGPGNSLEVQWLGLCAFTANGPGSMPGWGTKIPQAAWRGQRK